MCVVYPAIPFYVYCHFDRPVRVQPFFKLNLNMCRNLFVRNKDALLKYWSRGPQEGHTRLLENLRHRFPILLKKRLNLVWTVNFYYFPSISSEEVCLYNSHVHSHCWSESPRMRNGWAACAVGDTTSLSSGYYYLCGLKNSSFSNHLSIQPI